jgi:hypothetical protein
VRHGESEVRLQALSWSLSFFDMSQVRNVRGSKCHYVEKFGSDGH